MEKLPENNEAKVVPIQSGKLIRLERTAKSIFDHAHFFANTMQA